LVRSWVSITTSFKSGLPELSLGRARSRPPLQLNLYQPFLHLAQTPAPSLAGLLVVARTLDVLGQPFFLAHLLEPLHQLLDGFVRPGRNFDHKLIKSFLVLFCQKVLDQSSRSNPRPTAAKKRIIRRLGTFSTPRGKSRSAKIIPPPRRPLKGAGAARGADRAANHPDIRFPPPPVGEFTAAAAAQSARLWLRPSSSRLPRST
jgi:hypothetical protein